MKPNYHHQKTTFNNAGFNYYKHLEETFGNTLNDLESIKLDLKSTKRKYLIKSLNKNTGVQH